MENQVGELGLPKPQNHAPLPSFSYLVEFFETLEQIKGIGSVLKRHQCITDFIAQWKLHIGNDIYIAFQLCMPQLNEIYGGFKELSLGKVLVKSLNLNANSSDALQLTQSRRVFSKNSLSKEQDLGIKFKNALENRKIRGSFSDIKIDELLRILDKLTLAHQPEKISLMSQLSQRLSPLEMKWVVRVLLKTMLYDCSEKMFLQNFHPNAWDVFKVSSNLKVICDQLWDSEVVLESLEKSIKPLHCFKTMQAKYIPNLKVVESKFKDYNDTPISFIVEEKLDGERIQLHYTENGNVCKYFSRKGTEYTHIYGSNKSEGSITPTINFNAESCILDGEMVAYDTLNNEICAFSSVKQVHKLPNSNLKNIFMAFDILYKNGRDLTGYKLKDRKLILEKTVLDCPFVKVLPYKMANTAADIKEELDSVLEHMSEGLVVKHPLSQYVLDARVDAWIKVKPEYVHGFQGENFDLVVVGAYRGTGKRQGVYSSFLCALKNDKVGADYMTLTRVGTGFSTAIYEYLYGQLSPSMNHSATCPQWLTLGNEPFPDVFIKPESSVIMEVKATQISVHPANQNRDMAHFNYSLRFARFVKVREDKDFTMCMRVSEFLEYKEYLDSKFIKADARKQGGTVLRSKRVKYNDQPQELSSSIFTGMKFFVVCDADSPFYTSKEDLEKFIRSNGGSVVPFLSKDAIPIADKWSPLVLNQGLETIIHPKWVLDCLENNKLLPFEPSHYFYGKGASESGVTDKYGVSFVRKIGAMELSSLLQRMDICERGDGNGVFRELAASSRAPRSRGLLFADQEISLPSGTSPIIEYMVRYGSGRVKRLDLEQSARDSTSRIGEVCRKWESTNSTN